MFESYFLSKEFIAHDSLLLKALSVCMSGPGLKCLLILCLVVRIREKVVHGL